MTLQTDQTLSHYRLIEKIGEGGMGVVWKAKDTVLSRTVAIKVLPADVVRDKKRRQMFLDEARLASSVSDARIVQVHEFGHEGDLDFIVMEYVEGKPLNKLLHGRPLSSEKVADIGHQIARALSMAHRKKLLHRDLKPANILVTPEGDVKVVDFGLASLFAGRDTTLSTEGLAQAITEVPTDAPTHRGVAGTIPYMSPEQVRGEKLDHRSDIFSLGVMLYQMTTGHRPFSGATTAEIFQEIEKARPRAPHSLVSKVPLEMERIIQKSLASRRSNRYQTMEDLAVDLKRLLREMESGSAPSFPEIPAASRSSPRWTVVPVLVVTLMILAYVVWSTRETAPPPPPVESQPADAYYVRGLHYLREESETVRSLNDAIHMFNRMVEGNPDHARAWASLGEAYWKRFELDKRKSSREEAQEAVGRALKLDPALPEAHNARAVGLIAQGKFHAAREELEKALQERPTFDIAWGNLGRASWEMDQYAEGRSALDKAIELNPSSFRHWILLGNFFLNFKEHAEAEKAYRKAIELKPDSLMAWTNLGGCLMMRGRFEESAVASERSLKIEESASALGNLGTAYYYMGKYEEATDNYRRTTELEPDKEVHWGNYGDALRKIGKDDLARAVYAEAVRLARGDVEAAPLAPKPRVRLALWCARARDQECALREGKLALELQPENAHTLFRMAVIYSVLGTEDKALDVLEKAVRFGLSRAEIENDPDLEPLRALPRYREIVELTS